MQRLSPRLSCLGLALFVLAGASGCMVMNESNDRADGQRIQADTLRQFEPGTTTKAWTLAVLGKPTQTESLEDGTEILKYVYTRNKEEETVVFILFAGSTNRREHQTTYFEFKEGILVRFWSEKG